MTNSDARRTTLPPKSTPIDGSELRAGDILLSVGVKNDTSDAIRAFDGGAYSHAGLWTGEAEEVIESTTPSVVRYAFKASMTAHPREYVDVYRHQRVGDRGAAIIANAHRYVGRKYGFGDLALAGALVATTAWLPTEKAQEAALLIASGVVKLFKGDATRSTTLMTCSQLVAQAYFDAGLPIRVVPLAGDRHDLAALIKIIGAADELKPRAPLGASDGSDEAVSWGECQALLRERLHISEMVPRPLGAMDAGGAWGANLVTPYYLETSPDLESMGRYYPLPLRV